MINDHEKFSAVMSGIQSGIVAVAVVIGGLWTYFVFESELKIENAKAQLVKLKRDLEVLPALDINVEARQIDYLSTTKKILLVTVIISNKGTDDAEIDISEAPIRSTHIIITENGKSIFGESTASKIYGTVEESPGKIDAFDKLYARVGDTDRINLPVIVTHPGLYLIEFMAKMQNESSEGHGDKKTIDSWLAQTYAVVK